MSELQSSLRYCEVLFEIGATTAIHSIPNGVLGVRHLVRLDVTRTRARLKAND